MSRINPLGQGPKNVSPIGSVPSKGLRGRQTAPLNEAKGLAKTIEKQWNSWTLEELADKIIALEDRVSELKGNDPGVAKVKKVAEDFHFQFVFQVAKEALKGGASMPPTVYDTVRRLANRIIKENSVLPFSELNAVQQREIMRYGGGA